MRKLTAILWGLLLAFSGCNSPSSKTSQVKNVYLEWQDDCVGTPTSFEYGTTPNKINLKRIGAVAVSVCATDTIFKVSFPRGSYTATTVFYVRAYSSTQNAYSEAVFGTAAP